MSSQITRSFLRVGARFCSEAQKPAPASPTGVVAKLQELLDRQRMLQALFDKLLTEKRKLDAAARALKEEQVPWHR